ncbi:MAG: hypothetical protein KatS3mg077_0327 [Candidatus Binatia bacterium]|nr:MAG: hypothetical protein KatS3mg077_0327 [Candidatus Binatia bacterium]
MEGSSAKLSSAAAGQTLALGRGLVSVLREHAQRDRYARAQEEAMRSAVPSIAWAVLLIVSAYIGVQLWLRPSQVWAVWPAYGLQLLAPLAVLAGVRTRMWERHAETLFVVGEFVFTAALVSQVLSRETAIAGIAGFVAVKVMATALFVPWRARRQYASVAFTLALYGLGLVLAPHFADEPRKLHLVAVPAVAGILSVLGVAQAARLRETLLHEAADRDLAVKRLETVLDRMPVGCIISDAELRYVYWNKAAENIFGYSSDEVLGKSAVEVVTPPHLRNLSVRGFEELAQGRNTTVGPMRLENITKDGRTIICEWNAVALTDPDGAFVGMLSMCQDVTEQHRTEQARRELVGQLQEADRMRAAFVATLSHELRSPLNVILGYHELLHEGVFGTLSTAQLEVLDRIGQAARQLLELVTSTLEVSRIQAGRAALNLRLLQPLGLMEQIRSETLELQQKDGVSVEWDLSERLPPVYTDEAKLKVIVKNLLSNALKYTEAGTVKISARAVERGIEIAVSDTGPGIPEDLLPHIFEPFRRGEVDSKKSGAGLGLYLVRFFADLIGAQITVQSTVGQGSTFSVLLPIQPPGILVEPSG